MSQEPPPTPRPAKPRILLDALAYAPRDGGFTTALNNVLVSCREIDEFDFVVAHHRKYSSIFREFNFPTLPVNFPQKLRFFASLVLLPLLVRRARADAVHCEISALPAGLGVSGSVTVHDLFFLLEPETGGTTIGKRVMTHLYWGRVFTGSLRRARVVKAISRTTADDVRRLVGAELPVAVARPRVDAPRKAVPRRSWPDEGEPVRLLFVGNIVPRKNLPFLLQALPYFRGDWRLDIAGNLGWAAADLGAIVRDPRVTVHGYVSDGERDRLLAECHVLIIPSLWEGFCYPVAEAMSHGMLVLASDIATFREYVPAECRFALDDPRRLAERYNRLDAATYSRLLPLCRRAVRRFSAKAHLQSHRQIFHRLTESCQRRCDRPNLLPQGGDKPVRNH